MEKINLLDLAEKAQIAPETKEKLMEKIKLLSLKNPINIINETLVLLHSTYFELVRLRSAFFCTICDFDNQEAFNLVSREIGITKASCEELA